MFSCTKIVGSTLFCMLENEGLVDSQKMMPFYFPELAGTDWDKVPVEAALDMATGMNGTEHDEPEGELAGRMDPDKIWYKWAKTIGVFPGGSDKTPIEVIKTMELVKKPFEAYEYNSINTFLMNRIVETVADKPLAELFEEKIYSKMGAKHDASIIVAEQGYCLGFYGLMATARDLARFGMLFTPSYKNLTDEKVISDDIVENIQKGGWKHKENFFKGWAGRTSFGPAFEGETMCNRYQWDCVFEDGDFYKSGVGGQNLYISPARNMVVVNFATCDGKNFDNTMLREICKAVTPL